MLPHINDSNIVATRGNDNFHDLPPIINKAHGVPRLLLLLIFVDQKITISTGERNWPDVGNS